MKNSVSTPAPHRCFFQCCAFPRLHPYCSPTKLSISQPNAPPLQSWNRNLTIEIGKLFLGRCEERESPKNLWHILPRQEGKHLRPPSKVGLCILKANYLNFDGSSWMSIFTIWKRRPRETIGKSERSKSSGFFMSNLPDPVSSFLMVK
jgi:hypothetical protein